jgi:hypothetical protein
MRAALSALFLVAGAAVLAGAVAHESPGGVRSTPGCKNTTVDGATVVVYCGPAKATVKTGGKTYSFSGGKCQQSVGFWTILLGKQTLPPAKAKFPSFQGTAKIAKTKAGTYKKGEYTLAFQLPGKDVVISAGNPYLNTGSVTVTAGAKKGTFVGVDALKTSRHITGSWSC